MAEPAREVYYVLPAHDPERGYACTKGFCADKRDFMCGCPNCLRKDGLTLTFHAEDWNADDDQREHWRVRLVSLKTGRLAAHLICPHYPGYDPGPMDVGKIIDEYFEDSDPRHAPDDPFAPIK